MKVGVLALQGAFIEHIHILQKLGAQARKVRLPTDLGGLDGLIIPGGESTVIGKLAVMYDLMDPLRRFAAEKPVWGTCAGMILMARRIGQDQPLLGIMDIVVARNAFGRQQDSFEEDIDVSGIIYGDKNPFHGIFIRAPRLLETRGRANKIASLANGTPVAALEGRLLATAFHPELTNDTRFHRYFLEMIR
jgi:5'-phosphate synthase pdxT subunit